MLCNSGKVFSDFVLFFSLSSSCNLHGACKRFQIEAASAAIAVGNRRGGNDLSSCLLMFMFEIFLLHFVSCTDTVSELSCRMCLIFSVLFSSCSQCSGSVAMSSRYWLLFNFYFLSLFSSLLYYTCLFSISHCLAAHWGLEKVRVCVSASSIFTARKSIRSEFLHL